MAGDRDSWRQTFRSVGAALTDVVRAELDVIGERLKDSGRGLGISLGLVVAAGFLILICVPALLVLAAVAGLHSGLDWPLWGAALAVGGFVAAIGLGLAAVARYVMVHRFENPVAMVQDRYTDHVAWWNQRILSDENTPGGVDDESHAEPADAGDGTPGEPTAGA